MKLSVRNLLAIIYFISIVLAQDAKATDGNNSSHEVKSEESIENEKWDRSMENFYPESLYTLKVSKKLGDVRID